MYRQLGRSIVRQSNRTRLTQNSVRFNSSAPQKENRLLQYAGVAAASFAIAGIAAYWATPKTPQEKLKFAASQAKSIVEDAAKDVIQSKDHPAEVKKAASQASKLLEDLDTDRLLTEGKEYADKALKNSKSLLEATPSTEEVKKQLQEAVQKWWDMAPEDLKKSGQEFWDNLPEDVKKSGQQLLTVSSLADATKIGSELWSNLPSQDELKERATEAGKKLVKQIPTSPEDAEKLAKAKSKEIWDNAPEEWKKKGADLWEQVPDDVKQRGLDWLKKGQSSASGAINDVIESFDGSSNVVGASIGAYNAVNKRAADFTKDSLNDAVELGKDIVKAAVPAAHKAVESAGDAKETATKAVEDVKGKATDTVVGAGKDVITGKKSTEEAVSGVVDDAKKAAGDVVGKAEKTAGDVAGDAKKAVGEAKGKAEDMAGDAKGKAQNVAGDAKKAAGDAKEKAKDVAGDAKDKANEAKDQVKDNAGAAKDKAKEVAGDAKEKASDAKDKVKDAGEAKGKAEEAEQKGAYDPETGEINWDCPCLGGMAHGPCGEEFKEAFSCFVYSETEPKGIDCIKKFETMRSCFKRHPDHYKDELYEDDDDTSAAQPKSESKN
ncbi:hypothetical protein DICA1_F24322 [Diutina catenulata]